MTSSFYFWHWAADNAGGPPNEIHGSLVRGTMHPAIKPFDSTSLIAALETFILNECGDEDECEWTIIDDPATGETRFVVAHLSESEELTSALSTRVLTDDQSHVACYNEGRQRLEPRSRGENCFVSGQGTREYNVTADDIENLLLGLRRSEENAFAILINGTGFVQTFIKPEMGLLWLVEWRQFYDAPVESNGWKLWDQWKAQDPLRLPAVPLDVDWKTYDPGADLDPDNIEYLLVLEVFRAFLNHEPIPDLHWRNINDLLS